MISARAADPTADQVSAWETLNQQVVDDLQAGKANEALPLAEQALTLANAAFGPRDPRVLTSVSNMAEVLDSLGRYGEAEPLLRETLQVSREVLGPRHPDTLKSTNNLAVVLDDEGRYDEAEPLLRETLQQTAHSRE